VAWATLRAFHGATSSASTRAQIRACRCCRSNASASSCIPVIEETPNAAANGSGVNAATSGVPSPPSDSSWSRIPGNPVSLQVATPVSAVAGCGAHHCAANRSFPRSASRAAVSFSASSTSNQSASSSSTRTG
jgi:hypothetical protein